MERSKKLADALDKMPAQMESSLNYLPNEAEKAAEFIMGYDGAVVLDRGLAYPVALEGALKILETNRMKVRGYTISDFYGPVAQLHDGRSCNRTCPKRSYIRRCSKNACKIEERRCKNCRNCRR